MGSRDLVFFTPLPGSSGSARALDPRRPSLGVAPTRAAPAAEAPGDTPVLAFLNSRSGGGQVRAARISRATLPH